MQWRRLKNKRTWQQKYVFLWSQTGHLDDESFERRSPDMIIHVTPALLSHLDNHVPAIYTFTPILLCKRRLIVLLKACVVLILCFLDGCLNWPHVEPCSVCCVRKARSDINHRHLPLCWNQQERIGADKLTIAIGSIRPRGHDFPVSVDKYYWDSYQNVTLHHHNQDAESFYASCTFPKIYPLSMYRQFTFEV